VVAALRAWFEYRWDKAESMYDRAVKLQPGRARTHMGRAMAALCRGNIEAAKSGLSRAMEPDPLSASDCARMAYLHYVKGDFDAAAEHLRRSFELDRDYPEARFYEGLLNFQQQRYDVVIRCLSQSVSPLDIGLAAAAHAKAGNLSRADECIENLHQLASRQYVTPLAEGFAAIGIGDFDLAFHCLDEAINHKANFMNLSAVEPFFTPLLVDRRFGKVLKKLNLSQRPRP
jgi:serine/threonine-protein kinase